MELHIERLKHILFHIILSLVPITIIYWIAYMEHALTAVLCLAKSDPHIFPEKTYLKRLEEPQNIHLKELEGQRCNDSLAASAPRWSKIELKGGYIVYIADPIHLDVILYDGYGKQKATGGDHLRARLLTASVDAYSPGYILDHKNGTYTVTFEALWVGWAEVEVEILYPKELMAAALHIRKEWVQSIFLDLKLL